MAKGLTMWKAEDGKVFDTKEEAEAHEFAMEMVRRVGRREGYQLPYEVLKYLFQAGFVIRKEDAPVVDE